MYDVGYILVTEGAVEIAMSTCTAKIRHRS